MIDTKKIDAGKFARIPRKGGSVLVHPDDFKELMKLNETGPPPGILHGVNVYPDKQGGVKRGQVVAFCEPTLDETLRALYWT